MVNRYKKVFINGILAVFLIFLQVGACPHRNWCCWLLVMCYCPSWDESDSECFARKHRELVALTKKPIITEKLNQINDRVLYLDRLLVQLKSKKQLRPWERDRLSGYESFLSQLKNNLDARGIIERTQEPSLALTDILAKKDRSDRMDR